MNRFTDNRQRLNILTDNRQKMKFYPTPSLLKGPSQWHLRGFEIIFYAAEDVATKEITVKLLKIILPGTQRTTKQKDFASPLHAISIISMASKMAAVMNGSFYARDVEVV